MIYGNYKPEVKVEKSKKIALQKLMVGHFIEKIPEDCKKKIVYVLQGDGVWERRINSLGVFDSKVASADIPGLDETMTEGWDLNIPKIPINLLGTTVSFFRRIYKNHSSEVFLQFYYDKEKDDYILHCPKQEVSGASVRYENDPEYDSKILVLEIHSHGSMGAFFSSIDDADEKSDRFYGVIGNITNFFPDVLFRLVVGGREYNVDVEDLFDMDDELYHSESFPSDWVNKIKKRKPKRNRIRGKGQHKFPGGCNRSQVTLFGEEEDELDDIAKLFDDEHLGYGAFCMAEDEDDDDDGFYVKDGEKLWFVKDGEKRWYIQDGKQIKTNYEPIDYRGKKF